MASNNSWASRVEAAGVGAPNIGIPLSMGVSGSVAVGAGGAAGVSYDAAAAIELKIDVAADKPYGVVGTDSLPTVALAYGDGG